jgi:hypothetical protein
MKKDLWWGSRDGDSSKFRAWWWCATSAASRKPKRFLKKSGLMRLATL